MNPNQPGRNVAAGGSRVCQNPACRKTFYFGDQCSFCGFHQLDQPATTELKPPTLEVVRAAGYGPRAAAKIVEEQQALYDARAKPYGEGDPEPVFAALRAKWESEEALMASIAASHPPDGEGTSIGPDGQLQMEITSPSTPASIPPAPAAPVKPPVKKA
jgi:hypothetical protein